ncbi:MAG: hypothetical protein KG003_06630 [Bacteroidetes bacterium]|nr:hypothetical protein [Bacteroidota bacterium]
MNFNFIRGKQYFFILSGIVFLISCSKTEEDKRPFDAAKYYTYKSGNIREYYLDSFAYDQSTGTVKTYHFLIKENVMDSFTDLSGKPAVRIEQYISRDSGKNYEFYALSVVSNDNFGHQRVENNQRYLKIALPLVNKKTWNGNIFNNLGETEYEFTGIFEPFQSKIRRYSNSIIVTELNDSSVINADKIMSVYLRDTGLAYKLDKHLKYYPGDKVGGFIMEWNLLRYWPK